MYAIQEGITMIGGSISRNQGGGEWWDGRRWTPCSDRAKRFDSAEDAEFEKDAECDRDCRVIEIDED